MNILVGMEQSIPINKQTIRFPVPTKHKPTLTTNNAFNVLVADRDKSLHYLFPVSLTGLFVKRKVCDPWIYYFGYICGKQRSNLLVLY